MMTEVREIVLPGEVLGDVKEARASYGTFVEDDKIIFNWDENFLL